MLLFTVILGAMYSYSYNVTLIHAGLYGEYLKNPHGDVVSAYSKTLYGEPFSYDYDAFGNQTQSAAEDTNPFRYCGEYYDTDLDLIYLRARYYDPSIGRFITEDPIKDGLNWYAYANNNPIMFVDPWGLAFKFKTEKMDLTINGDAEIHGEDINIFVKDGEIEKVGGVHILPVKTYNQHTLHYANGNVISGELLCWATCAAMVENYYNPKKNDSFAIELAKYIQKQQDDVTFNDGGHAMMANDIASYEANWYKNGEELLAQEEVIVEILAGRPIIFDIMWEDGNGTGHELVISGIRVTQGNLYVRFNDPGEGSTNEIAYRLLGGAIHSGGNNLNGGTVVNMYTTLPKKG